MKTNLTLLPGSESSSPPAISRRAMLIRAALSTSSPATSPATPNAISSPGSADGRSPSDSPGSTTTLPSGPDRAPANPSAPPASARARRTKDTSGPSFDASSPSAILQAFLESRLRQRMAAYGSPEYALTWKHWDMPSGPPICALRASGRRTSGSEFGGWPTPNAASADMGGYQDQEKLRRRLASGHQKNLQDVACLAGWPSPTVGNATGSQMAKDASATGRRPDGSKATVSLNAVAQLAGWATPTSALADKGVRTLEGAIKEAMRSRGPDLAAQAALAGWATPTTRDFKDTGGDILSKVPVNGLLGRQVHLSPSGPTTTSSAAPTEKRGALNPAHSRWLLGFPPEWDDCGVTAMQSIRTSRRNSSKRSSKAIEAML